MEKSLPTRTLKLTLKYWIRTYLGWSYLPQSQDTTNTFNKKFQRALSAAYDNIIQEKLNRI